MLCAYRIADNPIDTGDKPFGCKTCGRGFARQDALSRHIRLHQRTGSVSISPTHTEPPVFTHQDVDTSQYPVPGEMILPQMTSDEAFAQPQLTNSNLFWPDSEGLLQNIMSIDPALWEQPMTLMPSALASNASPDLLFDPSMANTAGDEGHRAIQTLSTQLSNTLTGITTPVALTDLTSKFLDSCLHMFFSTFVPMLPVIHQPTFVFRECSPPLLLNAIAIGSLFLGTKEASTKVIFSTAYLIIYSQMIGRRALAPCTYCCCNILAFNDQSQGRVRRCLRIAACADIAAQPGICCTCKGMVACIEV
jgi:hypothetical protein